MRSKRKFDHGREEYASTSNKTNIEPSSINPTSSDKLDNFSSKKRKHDSNDDDTADNHRKRNKTDDDQRSKRDSSVSHKSKKQKKDKKKKSKKHKHSVRRSLTPEPEVKKPTIEQLRAARMEREAIERQRSIDLVSRLQGYSTPARSVIDERTLTYNTRYMPSSRGSRR